MNAFCSYLRRIFKIIQHTALEGQVRRLNAERHAASMNYRQQFVSMVSRQMGGAHRLREFEQAPRICAGKLSDLGIEALPRSSLLSANRHPPWQLCRGLFHLLLD